MSVRSYGSASLLGLIRADDSYKMHPLYSSSDNQLGVVRRYKSYLLSRLIRSRRAREAFKSPYLFRKVGTV